VQFRRARNKHPGNQSLAGIDTHKQRMSARMDDVAEVVSTPLQYGLRYAQFGWPVFACRENDKRPLAAGGFHTASTDSAQIIGTWQQHSRANIGIPTGKHFWVLDVDPRHGGNETLAGLEDKYGPLPDTLTANTPSGGWHYYFAPDRRARNSASKLGAGLDTRGDGGYVCVEGSIINGRRYVFNDFDPLTDSAPTLAVAPEWLIRAAFGSVAEKQPAMLAAASVAAGGRNDYLARQAGALRRSGMDATEIEAALLSLNAKRCSPPLPDDEVCAIAASISRYAPAVAEPPSHILELPPVEVQEERAQRSIDADVPLEQRKPLSDRPLTRLIDLPTLAATEPPAFDWWIPGWLSAHPLLLSGRGGVGKSLFALQLSIGLAAGKPLFGPERDPMRVLYWACEDDTDELHRRIHAICASMGISPAALKDTLYVDSRLGLDNMLLTSEFGRPMWTPQIETLRQQCNDLHIQLAWLDNLAHVYCASENDRSSVTTFVSGVVGLRAGPWCPGFIGHVAKAQGSEYAGSTAWENTVRMRWFLGFKAPDATPDDDDAGDTSARVLAKRKSNYSSEDILRMRVENRVFQVTQPMMAGGDVVGSISMGNHRATVLEALRLLKKRGMECSESAGKNYLPALAMRYGFNNGHTKGELEFAMRQLIGAGELVRGVVGKKANRTNREGLVIVADSVANNDAHIAHENC
jgi:RecA-family ATPase